MATISDIKTWAIADENITGNVGDTNLTLVTTDFHEVTVLEVIAPVDIEIIDIGVVGLGNTGGGGSGAVDSVNGKTGVVVLNQDEVLDGTTHKQYSSTEKTKLAGIATAATTNDTDANLKNRANHTGSQVISTVTGLQTAIDAKADASALTSHTGNTSNPHSVTKSQVGLGNVDNTTDVGKPVSTATQTALDAKAPLASPAFTGTPTGITKAHVGLSNVDNTADTAKPVSTAQQTALDGKAATVHTHVATDVTDFSTAVDARIANVIGTAPAALDTLGELSDALADDANFAATMTTALAGKASASGLSTHIADTANPHAVTKAQVGLGSVDNTADTAKPVSTAQQTALDLKAPLASPAFTGTPTGITKTHVGLGSVDNTADTAKPVSTAQQTALNLKAPLASPAFTGTPTGLTKTHVGLSNVDNTADTAKPVSTAQQTALDLKAPLASPAFTGTPTGITKTHVGLGSVDNTADTAKPVSTAQQTALDARMVWADGSTSTNARPTTSSKVIWVGGTTQPVNMTTGDLWVKA